MEDCRTPTLSQMMEFKYEVTPTMIFEQSCLQEAQNRLVSRINVRCFTPTIKNFQSPGLSPINECTPTILGGVAVDVKATVKEVNFKAPKKPKSAQQKQAYAQQKYCKQQAQANNVHDSHFVSESPPVITLNSTINSDTDFVLDITSPDSSAIFGSINNNNNNNNSGGSSTGSVNMNNSNNATFTNSNNNTPNATNNFNNTNLLDRTMNVSTLLRSIGLEQYTEMFEVQDLDLEQFLNMRAEDFQRLGVHDVDHQRKLLNLLSEMNVA